MGETVRRVRGNYDSISRKWLQGDLNEFAWRYNRRYENGKRKVPTTDRAMFLLLLDKASRRERAS